MKNQITVNGIVLHGLSPSFLPRWARRLNIDEFALIKKLARQYMNEGPLAKEAGDALVWMNELQIATWGKGSARRDLRQPFLNQHKDLMFGISLLEHPLESNSFQEIYYNHKLAKKNRLSKYRASKVVTSIMAMPPEDTGCPSQPPGDEATHRRFFRRQNESSK